MIFVIYHIFSQHNCQLSFFLIQIYPQLNQITFLMLLNHLKQILYIKKGKILKFLQNNQQSGIEMKINLNNLISLGFKFSTQGAGKKRYVNIGKMIKQQQQQEKMAIQNGDEGNQVRKKSTKFSQNKLNDSESNNKKIFDRKSFHSERNPKPNHNRQENPQQYNTNLKQNLHLNESTKQQNEPDYYSQQSLQNLFKKDKQQHMSTQQQQINFKIKSAIKCDSIYYICMKYRHKLQPHHYTLMFSKILQLRKNNHKEKGNQSDYQNFLNIVFNNLDKISPEDLIKMSHQIKFKFINRQEIKPLLPIIEYIINQFSNQNNTQYDPKSFETMKLNTTMKMLHSFLFILNHTGSYFQTKLKKLLRQAIDYIAIQSMKNLRFAKSNEYVEISNKIFMLYACKTIQAPRSIIKNLIRSLLMDKKGLTFEQLLTIQRTIFQSTQLLKQTRLQLLTINESSLKGNILYRIEKQIQSKFVHNLDDTKSYSFLSPKLIQHLQYVNNKFSYREILALNMKNEKDQQVLTTLRLFHQGYRKYFQEISDNSQEKQAVETFFNKSQSSYALYYLLNYLYKKLSQQSDIHPIKPNIKTQLKQFINLLCKYFSRLNFMVQSVVIQYLIFNKYSNLKPIFVEYFEWNTQEIKKLKNKVNIEEGGKKGKLLSSKYYFFANQNQLNMDRFFQMLQYQNKFKQSQCQSHYQVFINSNLKKMLKFIFQTNDMINTEKNAYFLAYFWNQKSQQNAKSQIKTVLQSYLSFSQENRSFNEAHIDIIDKNQQYFLKQKPNVQTVELDDQTDIFGNNNLEQNPQQKSKPKELISNLQNDKDYFRQHYDLQIIIRVKIRKLLKNFKFIVLLLQNIKLSNPTPQLHSYINKQIYPKILQNFKNQAQFLKYQKLFTKQNYQQLNEIYNFLVKQWQKSQSFIQISNESLIYKHQPEINKENYMKQEDVEGQQEKKQYRGDKIVSKDENDLSKKEKQENGDQEEIVVQQQQQQSQDLQQHQTQQTKIIKGKDLIQMQTFTNYMLRQKKKQTYFKMKNLQFLQEVAALTDNFGSMPEVQAQGQEELNEKNVNENEINVLKTVYEIYKLSQMNNKQSNTTDNKNQNSNNPSPQTPQSITQNKTKKIKIIDLPSIDQQDIAKQNYFQELNLQIQNEQKRTNYQIKIYTKKYPSLLSLKFNQQLKENQQENKNNQSKRIIYYVYTKKSKIWMNNKKEQEENKQESSKKMQQLI